MATKRTYQPKKLHGQKVHGFRKRMASTAFWPAARAATAARSWPVAALRAAPVCPTEKRTVRETLEQRLQGRREFCDSSVPR